jgi:hypothetical protein
MKIEQTIQKFIDLGYSEPEIRCAMNQARIKKTDQLKIKKKSFNKIIKSK